MTEQEFERFLLSVGADDKTAETLCRRKVELAASSLDHQLDLLTDLGKKPGGHRHFCKESFDAKEFDESVETLKRRVREYLDLVGYGKVESNET